MAEITGGDVSRKTTGRNLWGNRNKGAQTMNLLELNQGNRTIRKFRQEQIPDETIQYIMENVRLCHCANNRQILRFVVVRSAGYCKKVGDLLHYAALLPAEAGMPKPDERPTAYIVITAPKQGAGVADMDAGIASQVITQAAHEKGIGSCILFNFNKEDMDRVLNLSEERTSRLVVSLGYPAIASRVEDAINGDVRYYIAEDGYHVPKLPLDELFSRI